MNLEGSALTTPYGLRREQVAGVVGHESYEGVARTKLAPGRTTVGRRANRSAVAADIDIVAAVNRDCESASLPARASELLDRGPCAVCVPPPDDPFRAKVAIPESHHPDPGLTVEPDIGRLMVAIIETTGTERRPSTSSVIELARA